MAAAACIAAPLLDLLIGVGLAGIYTLTCWVYIYIMYTHEYICVCIHLSSHRRWPCGYICICLCKHLFTYPLLLVHLYVLRVRMYVLRVHTYVMRVHMYVLRVHKYAWIHLHTYAYSYRRWPCGYIYPHILSVHIYYVYTWIHMCMYTYVFLSALALLVYTCV